MGRPSGRPFSCLSTKLTDLRFSGMGQHKLKTSQHRMLWWRHGALGFISIGTGLSVTLDASAQRMANQVWWIWTVEGTLGLIVFMSGLGLFGSAVRHLVLMDLSKK